ncbi:uncharacterized protein CLUP02_17532 [Colletotrichum lupini]|uniref:Uncharacterized protein n=1 Tax=Colletotrichum lupini TaxID=145971 RepID=A0A9Q8SEP6_9PEZI|nr:uncharacterized protein CLUP02_17532 [Colletotrichum lupini]UQC76021.1 hypothetical protein CLUP02_17532 [Colletotrichum lupini]
MSLKSQTSQPTQSKNEANKRISIRWCDSRPCNLRVKREKRALSQMTQISASHRDFFSARQRETRFCGSAALGSHWPRTTGSAGPRLASRSAKTQWCMKFRIPWLLRSEAALTESPAIAAELRTFVGIITFDSFLLRSKIQKDSSPAYVVPLFHEPLCSAATGEASLLQDPASEKGVLVAVIARPRTPHLARKEPPP